MVWLRGVDVAVRGVEAAVRGVELVTRADEVLVRVADAGGGVTAGPADVEAAGDGVVSDAVERGRVVVELVRVGDVSELRGDAVVPEVTTVVDSTVLPAGGESPSIDVGC